MNKRFPVACLAILFGVCLLELAARNLFFPQYTAMLPDMYAPHPVLGHFNKPDLSVRRYNPMNYDVVNRTNGLGLRGGSADPAADLSGIWVAGASNTFGGFVEDGETYAAQLQQYGYRSANLASEGHGIVNQTLVIRMLADMGFRPRAVVLGITMYQPISDYSSSYDAFSRPLVNTIQKKADGVPQPLDNLTGGIEALITALPTSLQSLRARLLKSSALYGWLKVGIMGVPALRDFTLRAGLRNELYLVRNFDLNLLRPLSPSNPRAAHIDSTADYIAALKKLVTNRLNVPFGVVLIPSLQQMDPKSLQRFESHYGLAKEDLDAHRAPRALLGALRNRGVPVLDVLPALRSAGSSDLHFPDDGHMTAKAHAVVGKALAEWLAEGFEAGPPIFPSTPHRPAATK